MSQRGGRYGGGRGHQPPSRGGGGGGRSGRGRGSAPSPSPAPAPRPTSSYPSPSPFAPPPPSSSSPIPPPSTREAASTSSVDQVVSSVSADVSKLTLRTPAVNPPAVHPPVSSKALSFPRRPGLGSRGHQCTVRANHFLVKLQEKDLHHYDVSITPEVISRGVNRAVMKQLVDQYTVSHLGGLKPVYDGRKGLYTAGPLPFTSKEFVVKLGEKGDQSSQKREREFHVAIKFAAKTDLQHLMMFLAGRQKDAPQETIQALDIVLRESPSNKYTVFQRSFYSLKFGHNAEIGDGLECWRGFYQSIRPTQMGMSLNIDVGVTSFYESIPMVEFVMKLLHKKGDSLSRPLTDMERVKIKKAVRGLKVELTHRKEARPQKITGVTTQPISQLMFTIDDESGQRISVAQYFAQKYKLRLQFTHWPALQAGSDSRPSYFPMEICKIIEGQRYSKKLNEEQVTAILKASCQRPSERERRISEMAALNNYREDPFAKEFGIDVDTRLATANARVLEAPMLKYHDTGRDVRIQPRVGQWNMINTKMVNGATINHWAAVSFSRNLHRDVVGLFIEDLVGMCASKGMVFNRTPLIEIQSARSDQIEKTLVDIHQKCTKALANRGQTGELQLLIVILPDVRGQYGKIKRICETELGIVSQCCQPKQAQKGSKQYLENVSLKINVKAGGRNNVLMDALMRRIPLVSDKPTIIFGADVTHPPPGEDSSPSIAAVVASMDWPEVTKYKCLVSAQQHRSELIQDLYKMEQDPQKGVCHSGMIRELLRSFRIATGQRPQRIIFYRDGVSEGQFSQVLLHEVDAIHRACSSLEDGYLPPVTFVVVQKRHHTRLFPADHGNRNLTDKSGNVLPGTVVDTQICHPTEFDFYLCSHAGIQGTSRPTHYHVLWDANKFSADQLQTLTNNLCYTYARCTRSVSVVPPAYYAHLGAFRARYYMEDDFSESGTTPGGTRAANVEPRRLPKIKDNVKEVMFYC